MLRAMAKLWIVSDNLTPVDAIVVLGGGLGVRPPAAAELYRLGVSRRVIVARAEIDRGRHARHNREALIRHGVPPAAIADFNFETLSTYGEALGVVRWAKANRIKSVAIPIDMFSTRRVRWIFQRVLGSEGVYTVVHAVPPSWYNADDWWRHHVGRTDFRNEVLKLAYYRWKY
jgi:uncharacterized SAM-binding protein YcdF (DUF218 family)